ncbi:Bardet-Biedl syndrome 1 protein [Blattella germanica]|nr:Bardet-Biedl syndrome 1 protein [Blattella germanica]
MTLADINSDGDYKLIIADLGTGTTNIKLKVYKGTSLMSESTLMDVPCGVVTFHMDMSEPRVPGPNVYIYKNMRPYFKFSLPSMEVNPLEHDLWMESVITSITTLKKSMAEADSASCLVVGTESSDIYILDPEAFTILENMNLGGPGNVKCVGAPVHLGATGLYDVEFRVLAACRDGSVHLVRRGWSQSRILVQLPAHAVAMVILPENSSIVIALMDETLHGYSRKGKKQWELKLPNTATAMAPIHLQHQGMTLVAVALTGGTVNLYSGRQVMDTITAPDSVSGILFGRFGQEEHSLVLVTISGHLVVKILKRTAQFIAQSSATGIVPPQQIKMLIPKKTKLFMEQTLRERESALGSRVGSNVQDPHYSGEHVVFDSIEGSSNQFPL